MGMETYGFNAGSADTAADVIAQRDPTHPARGREGNPRRGERIFRPPTAAKRRLDARLRTPVRCSIIELSRSFDPPKSSSNQPPGDPQ